MRKECKRILTTSIADISGYHSGNNLSAVGIPTNYAFRGFNGSWYFNSDRREELIPGPGGLLYRKSGQPMEGYGLEIETECRGITNRKVLADVMDKIVFPVFKFGADMFKMQSDISLGGDTSVECITQVMTKSRIRNDYPAYRAMFDEYFPAFGISAASSNCGMHVNVSNAVFGKTVETQAVAIRKLYYIVNKHFDFCCKLFGRNPERTRYCGRMDYSGAKTLDLNSASASHGNCMNLSHFPEGRIEIRLVGGQPGYYSFRNTMECVFFLCERVRSISWADCDDIVKIFTGCNNYVMKRLPDCGLSTEQLAAIRETVKTEDLELRRN